MRMPLSCLVAVALLLILPGCESSVTEQVEPSANEVAAEANADLDALSRRLETAETEVVEIKSGDESTPGSVRAETTSLSEFRTVDAFTLLDALSSATQATSLDAVFHQLNDDGTVDEVRFAWEKATRTIVRFEADLRYPDDPVYELRGVSQWTDVTPELVADIAGHQAEIPEPGPYIP